MLAGVILTGVILYATIQHICQGSKYSQSWR